DGWDDILVVDDKGVFLFRGFEGGRFAEVTEASGLPKGLDTVPNAVFADLDNDGLVDLLLDSRVFRNRGGFRFEEITQSVKFQFGNVNALTVGDYDRDGRVDIYVARTLGAKSTHRRQDSWIDGPG